MRIGYGEDIHQLGADRPLVLAGVTIPFNAGLIGHSDADVVIHAICDSLLGALALGDIGQHFPNTDVRYLNIDSAILLKKTFDLVIENAYQIHNIDVTVILEKPHLAPYILSMRGRIAEILQIDVQKISIKAGTNEGLDAIGRGKAIKAIAVTLLEEIKHD
ncbi:MAG TPA: 2-C-methyl-D-erythritol 2,4-cyclodiphosphate synthase [Bacilli bacterium]|jgi:2-C-methyl-D-erythritol 2,4-cyclodiphosphate synthase|nr:2-C-methyl-D-erythritol 2,4-cyclodiphosphate synthase [Bacilli bacterium]MDD3389582.1 2-C-methyl-D-erythritol 2,4-cyclodiphosphate synthase [Bacilli bacterium]MDD4344757.1 2-C-methyl-D-erythritol 2,4-cyclodiphosphate synthase [Bacilli bacterium]MDD4520919.1 2-C-methyl-D-erythritol 2,4-cyclodiphosphate synthase [Bacilli bacterium]MDY0399564.1 2-C-methyl-D-erythritol 2,4-cyclodiphosphate synthase [Bacilli bacterium]